MIFSKQEIKNYIEIMSKNDKKEFYEKFGSYYNNICRSFINIINSFGQWIFASAFIGMFFYLVALTHMQAMENFKYFEYIGSVDKILLFLFKCGIAILTAAFIVYIFELIYNTIKINKFIKEKNYHIKLKTIELEKLIEEKNK